MKAIYDLIKSDADMIYILEVVESLNLNDSWVSAGFIRNKFGIRFMVIQIRHHIMMLMLYFIMLTV